MEFEEFFKKKKIDLPVLEKTEPALFSEFKTHYGQMGEKSFDHTKKYWFNKLRRQFPLAPEIKTEKPHIANPIAEQTVTESLIETVMPPPSPKVGFTPRFKAGAATIPAEVTADKKEVDLPVGDDADAIKEQPSTTATPPPKVGFTPRFKAGVTSKPVEPPTDKKDEALTTEDNTVKEQPLITPPSPKVGFTPRFKAGTTPKQVINADDKKEEISPAAAEEPTKETNPEESIGSKPAAYKPRFKMKPKTDEE